jgi:hypothetical protein
MSLTNAVSTITFAELNMTARKGTGSKGESSLAASIAALAFCRIASRFDSFDFAELCEVAEVVDISDVDLDLSLKLQVKQSQG